MHRSSEALMHAVLDGEASEREENLLTKLLESDPEARRRFEALREFHQLLDQTPPLEPPPELATEVLARLPARTGTVPGSSRPRKGWWALQESAAPLRYAAAFAIGLALAAGIYELGLRSDPFIDPLQVTGSMLGGQEIFAQERTEQVDVNFPGIRGSVRSGRLLDLGVLVFDLETQSGVSLALAESGHGEVTGLVWLEDGSGDALIENRTVWIRETGHRRFALLLRDPEAVVRLHFYRDIGPGEGAPAHELAIPVPAARLP